MTETVNRVASLAVLAGNGAAFLTATNILAPPVLAGAVEPSFKIALFLIAPAIGMFFGFVAIQWAHDGRGAQRARSFTSWAHIALIFSVVSTIAALWGLDPLPIGGSEAPLAVDQRKAE